MKDEDVVIVVGYMRVSSRGQIDGDGFHRQKSAIEEFCRFNLPEYHIQFAREEGVPGKTAIEERPMLASMLVSWDSGEVKKPYAIVVENLDRLSRDLMIQECAIDDFRKRGIKVFACNWGFVDVTDDVDDPSRALIRQVLGAVAQYAKTVGNQRMYVARARKRDEKGKCEGRKYFGEKDPHDRMIANRILTLKSLGFSSRRIAKVLTLEGVITSRGYELNDRLVRRVIKRHKTD